MPFLRLAHPETSVSPRLKFFPRRPKRNSKLSPKRRAFGLLTLCSLSAPALLDTATAQSKVVQSQTAQSKPFRAVGVKAWTSGSETFIRSRPSAEVPPVAKVARHTPLYVWGKYNGWYRVETHDHIFGWVFNPYITAPKGHKVRAMPASKARLASDRTADQTMYGTPEQLKKHYAAYRAPGALKGLREHGIRLAIAPETAAKPKTVLARAVAKSASEKSEKSVARPDGIVQSPPRLSPPRLARAISPVPSAERLEKRVPTAPVAASAVRPVVKPVVKPFVKPVVKVARLERKAVVSSAPREVEAAKIADSARGLTPSAKFFARAASQAALRREISPQNLASGEAPLTDSNFEPVPFQAPVSIKPVAPRVRISAPSPRKIAKKSAKKPLARKPAKKRLASRKDRQRQQLRARMGAVPSAPRSVIAPVSPLELMRARQEYLAERKARLGLPATSPAEVPVVGLEPLPAPGGPLGGPSDALPPASPGEFAPMSFEPSHPLAPLLGDPYVLALAQLKPKKSAELSAVGALAPLPVPQTRAMRGGSPRDRFGSGMASQALSYRGMRYVRGAASPNRGFDCSGLIYFLLRQRGYNPPRTAAGYRNWGQGVSKSQLKSGDLLLFANTYKRGISHIGVYLGNGKFVHAATSSTGVRVSSLGESYYAGKYYGARRAK